MSNWLNNTRCVLVLVFLSFMHPLEASELGGLWKSHKHFGPEVRDTLTIRRINSSWQGTISGLHAVAPISGDAIRLDLPDENGRFVGKLDNTTGVMSGHWIQPPPRQVAYEVASPVHFRRIDDNGWSGKVIPLESEYTFYLSITEREGHVLKAFLRNPERNAGVLFNLERVERTGNELRFLGPGDGGAGENVVLRGAYDGVNDTIVVHFPDNRGGSHEFIRIDDDHTSDFYARGRNPAAYEYAPPPVMDDGWQTGTLAEAGISFESIKRMIEKEVDPVADSVHSPYVHGLLITRRGKLVFEEYFHGYSRSIPHDTRSASKSLTSVLVGAVIQASKIKGVSLPVYETFNHGTLPDDLDENAHKMNLEHLLTMSSGLACNDFNPQSPGQEDSMLNQNVQSDWYRYTLDLPIQNEPGTVTAYCSAGANLAAGLISIAADTPVLELLEELVAAPLGIKRYYAWLQPDGQPYMGGGIHWMPRDFIKLGQLMLNGGEWNGKRVVSEEWARRSISGLKQLLIWKYGYLWWQLEYSFDERTVDAFFASGNGGQFVIVVPALDMVINFWGGNYGDTVIYKILREWVPNYILPAVTH